MLDAFQLKVRVKIALQTFDVDRGFVVGKETIEAIPNAPDEIGKRTAVRLHEAQVSAGFQNAMQFSDGALHVRMNVMQTADNDHAIESVVGQAGIEQRTVDGVGVGPARLKLLDHFVRDVEAGDVCAAGQEIFGRLAAAAHRVEHVEAGEIEAGEHRIVDEAATVFDAPLVAVMRFIVGGDLVVVLLLLPFGDIKLRLPGNGICAHRCRLHRNGIANAPIKTKPARLAYEETRVRRGSTKFRSTTAALAGNEINRAPSLSGRVCNSCSPLWAVQCG